MRVRTHDTICPVAIDPKLLNPGERVLVSTRTHIKALIGAELVFLALLVVGVLLSVWVSNGTVLLIAWILIAIAMVVFSLVPLLRWMTSTYTFTDRRLITRHGVITRRGHDIPLNRISDVASERGPLDRMLGCGTLIISDASTHGSVRLPDLPRVEEIQLKLSQELSGGNKQGHDADA